MNTQFTRLLLVALHDTEKVLGSLLNKVELPYFVE